VSLSQADNNSQNHSGISAVQHIAPISGTGTLSGTSADSPSTTIAAMTNADSQALGDPVIAPMDGSTFATTRDHDPVEDEAARIESNDE